MASNREERGANNPTNSAYTDTVADYTPAYTPVRDNILQSVTCDSTVYVGAVVRMNGSTAINAVADSSTNSKAIGICVSKTSATVCDIQVCGATNSILAGLSTNQNYFLSEVTPGSITTTPPTGSSNIVIHIGRSYSSTQLVLQLGVQIRRAV